MIDLDLVITVDEVEEILEDLEDDELLREGQAEAILRAHFGENPEGTTTLGALLEVLLLVVGEKPESRRPSALRPSL